MAPRHAYFTAVLMCVCILVSLDEALADMIEPYAIENRIRPLTHTLRVHSPSALAQREMFFRGATFGTPRWTARPHRGPLRFMSADESCAPHSIQQASRLDSQRGPAVMRALNDTNVGEEGVRRLWSAYSGTIVLTERGQCDFVRKAIRAEKLGAVGVLVSTWREEEVPVVMGSAMPLNEASEQVHIPVFMIPRGWYEDFLRVMRSQREIDVSMTGVLGDFHYF